HPGARQHEAESEVTMGSLFGGGGGGGMTGGMMQTVARTAAAGAAANKPPEPTPVAPMLDEGSPMIREAARRRSQSILGRGGRPSTIRRDAADNAAPYSRTTIG